MTGPRARPSTAGIRWGTLIGAWLSGAAATYALHGQDVRAGVFSGLAVGAFVLSAFSVWRLVSAHRGGHDQGPAVPAVSEPRVVRPTVSRVSSSA